MFSFLNVFWNFQIKLIEFETNINLKQQKSFKNVIHFDRPCIMTMIFYANSLQYVPF